MTITTPRVLDSAEWAFDEYRAEVIGEIDPLDDDFDALCAAGIQAIATALGLYWLTQGYVVEFVSARDYGRMTWNDEAINETASSYHLPDSDDALALWAAVVATITHDEVRQIAGLA